MFGFLNINKSSGITSHKVISVLRKITGIKQIGHAGTLDPLAQGVLPVAIGKAAKLIDLLKDDKSYRVELKLGYISDTYDIEGNIEELTVNKVNLEAVKDVLSKFKGKQKQIPPAFSAVHYNGKRLYELARSGKIPEDIPIREITIYENKLLNFNRENQTMELEISCSKGTYIRSIVNDIGKYLGTGAVMTKLIRTQSSGMNLADSLTLNENLTKEDIEKNIINPKDILTINVIKLSEEEYKYVRNGNKFKTKTQLKGECLLCFNDKITALAEVQGEFIQPKKVLL